MLDVFFLVGCLTRFKKSCEEQPKICPSEFFGSLDL